MKHPVGVSAYPQSFRGCKVSKGKICLQFNDPQLKLRLLGTKGEMLPKNTGDFTKVLPVPETGVDIEVIAVGCNLKTIVELKKLLEEAIAEHEQLYGKVE